MAGFRQVIHWCERLFHLSKVSWTKIWWLSETKVLTVGMAFMEMYRDATCCAFGTSVVYTLLRIASSDSARKIRHTALAVRLDIHATHGAMVSLVAYRDHLCMTCVVPVKRTFLYIAH
jgi:hypothetical protein